MNADDKINLQNILQQSDAEETTDKIRNLKHSQQIKEDVTRMIELKTKYARLRSSNADQFESMCISQCNFLFTKYTKLRSNHPRIIRKMLKIPKLLKHSPQNFQYILDHCLLDN